MFKEGEVSQEDRIIFNNYQGTKKQLKFDNMSSCSLMLSKSGASTIKEKSKHQFRTNKQFNRDSSIPTITRSFVSTGNNVGGYLGAPIVTTSSIRQNTFLGGLDSQVSGNGSILH